jgi:hypothetical protein
VYPRGVEYKLTGKVLIVEHVVDNRFVRTGRVNHKYTIPANQTSQISEVGFNSKRAAGAGFAPDDEVTGPGIVRWVVHRRKTIIHGVAAYFDDIWRGTCPN